MIRRFSNIVISGRLEPEWPETAMKTQVLLDGCMKSAFDLSHPIKLA